MIFSVLQYLPVIKEKNNKFKSELIKKILVEDANETSNDDADDDNGNDDESDLFLSDFTNTGSKEIKTAFNLIAPNPYYKSSLQAIPSPPPKI